MLPVFDLGLRAHYEVRREFAPYVGVEWQASFGNTADIVRGMGEEARQNGVCGRRVSLVLAD